MKNADDFGLSALRQMGELSPPALEPDLESRRQHRMSSAIDRQLETLGRSKVRRSARTYAVLAGVALASVLSFLVWSLPRAEDSARVLATTGQVTVTPGALASAAAGSPLEARRQLSTGPRSSAEVLLASKARLSVEQSTTLWLELPSSGADAPVERVNLSKGRVGVSVPKLSPGHRLLVETPDATVTVRGTRFSVSVDLGPDARTVTRVAVEEGRVEVVSAGRSEFLTRGHEWSSARAAVAAAAPLALASAPAPDAAASAARTGPVLARKGVSTRGASVPPADGALAEQNRIFQRALENARSGNAAGALADLEELIQKHPRSPLMQSVRVEHFRLLHQVGNVAAAAREARSYLSTFPAGFARAEARRLALLDVADSP